MLKNYLTCFGTKSKIIFPGLQKYSLFYFLTGFNFTFCSALILLFVQFGNNLRAVPTACLWNG